jgi:hypothetical protein
MNRILNFAYRAADDLSVIEESDIENLDVRVDDSDDLRSARNLPEDYPTHTKRGAGVPVEEYQSCSRLSGIIDSLAPCRTAPILCFERMESCQSSWIKSNHTVS